MSYKWRLLWLGVVILLLCITLAIFKRDGTDLDSRKADKNPYEKAIEDFDPLKYHTKRALAYEAERSYGMAIKEYEKILKINPEDSVSHSHLGAMYYRMGKIDQAISEIKEILRIDPNNWVQREALADLYCKQERYDLAIQEYERSLRINPNNALANSLLGKAYYENGDYWSAMGAYERSIGIDPRFREAHLGLGMCYLARGDIEKALREKQILEDLDKGFASQLSKAIKNRQATERMPKSSH